MNDSKLKEEINGKAIEKFLERMHIARFHREAELAEMERMPGSGKIWKNQITKPKAPKLSEQPARKNDS